MASLGSARSQGQPEGNDREHWNRGLDGDVKDHVTTNRPLWLRPRSAGGACAPRSVRTSILSRVSAFALILFTACGGVGVTGGRTAGANGIKGIVLIGPQCAAVQSGHQCPDKPVEAEIRVRKASGASNPKGSLGGVGKVLATAHSGHDGRFRIPLSPGSYALQARAPGAVSCAAVDVTVLTGQYPEVIITCDSGVR